MTDEDEKSKKILLAASSSLIILVLIFAGLQFKDTLFDQKTNKAPEFERLYNYVEYNNQFIEQATGFKNKLNKSYLNIDYKPGETTGKIRMSNTWNNSQKIYQFTSTGTVKNETFTPGYQEIFVIISNKTPQDYDIPKNMIKSNIKQESELQCRENREENIEKEKNPGCKIINPRGKNTIINTAGFGNNSLSIHMYRSFDQPENNQTAQ
jgi:uncharacterized protein YozE (UPF0346 family)